MQSEFVSSKVMCTNADNDIRSYINLLEKWTLNINLFTQQPSSENVSSSSFNSSTSTVTASSNTTTTEQYRYCLKQLNNYNFPNSNMSTPLRRKETKICSLSKTSSSSSSLSSSPSASSTTSSSSSSYASYQQHHYETNFFHKNNFIPDNNFSRGSSESDKIVADTTTNAALPNIVKSCLESTVPNLSYGIPQHSSQTKESISGKSTDIDNKYLIYRDGNLISGNFSALVQHLVPTLDYYPSRSYLFTFLLTSRLFTTPYELLVNIITVCNLQQNFITNSSNATSSCSEQRLISFVPRLLQLIKEWTELFPRDFQDEYLLNYSVSVMERCVRINQNLREDMNNILCSLVKRIRSVEHYEQYIASITAGSIAESINDLDVSDTFELCSSPRTVAECLCHIELNRLAHISSEEFVQEYAKNKRIIEKFYKNVNRLQSFNGYVEWFNKLSLTVATDICRHNRKKYRSRTIEFWVEIARECFNIGNFNSLMSIISGLNMSPVVRLKKTWNKVQSGKFSILEHQMDPTSNFSSYRSTLKAAMWRSAGTTDKMQQIIIPFFSLLIKDIYFLNECCVNKLPNDHINFEKFWHLAKQVTEFMVWKQISCPFPKDSRIIAFLQECPVLSLNALTRASFECEPPDSSAEKDQYKSLKSETHQ